MFMSLMDYLRKEGLDNFNEREQRILKAVVLWLHEQL